MRYDLIAQTIKKKSDPKNWKTVKIKVKSLHRNIKSARKQNFCSNTDFSLYFKIRVEKISRRKTTRLFPPLPVSAWLKSLLQLNFKSHEN